MSGDPSVLFSVLYFGEVEFAKCIESIHRLITLKNYDVKCYAYKSILDAHHQCYFDFSEGNYDILVKVDGDMVFQEDLSNIIVEFSSIVEDKHWAIDVFDGYTRSMIPALHIYKRGYEFVGFDQINPDKFSTPVDKWITDRFLITHAEDNNSFQAFRTGFYRGQKTEGRSGKFIKQYIERAKDNFWLSKGIDVGLSIRDRDIIYDDDLIFKSYISATREFFKNKNECL